MTSKYINSKWQSFGVFVFFNGQVFKLNYTHLQPISTTKNSVSQWSANIYPTNQFSFPLFQVCCIAANFHVETSEKEENPGL